MIVFDGITIITATEGVFLPPTIGMMPRVWSFKRLIRANGEVSHDRGRTGVDHQVTVIFLDVAVADVGTIWDRIESLVATPREGILTIPDFGTYPNCVCTDPGPAPATRGLKNLAISGGLSFDATYNMQFALTFHQSR